MVGMNVLQYLLNLVAVIYVGHLGQLELAASSLATTLVNISGHIMLVSAYSRGLSIASNCSLPPGMSKPSQPIMKFPPGLSSTSTHSPVLSFLASWHWRAPWRPSVGRPLELDSWQQSECTRREPWWF